MCMTCASRLDCGDKTHRGISLTRMGNRHFLQAPLLAVAAGKEATRELYTILIQCTLVKVEFDLL